MQMKCEQCDKIVTIDHDAGLKCNTCLRMFNDKRDATPQDQGQPSPARNRSLAAKTAE